MEPKTYLSGERLEPMRLPDFKEDFKNYERFDIGAMGEFDVAVLLDQYAGAETSHSLYPHWRGGYYYAVQPKGDASAPLGLLYVSRWSGAERRQSSPRSMRSRWTTATSMCTQTCRAGNCALKSVEISKRLTGSHTWMTEQGPVVIDVQNENVLMTESLDQPTTDRVEQELLRSESCGG